ncbi:hypothetical protein ScPMuIL_004770 [Solemya velum]
MELCIKFCFPSLLVVKVTSNIRLQPTTLFLDYEVAIRNAATQVFPGINIEGCFFHYTQCIWRNAQKHGLQVPYKDNNDIRTLEWGWYVQFRSPKDIFEKHWSYLFCEFSVYLFAVLTLMHALKNGGRFRWLWLGTVLHGLTVECVSYFVPDIDNFWHAQSSIMLLGQRLPLHIICFYPALIYTASAAVAHMKLQSWAEPFAVGLTVVLMDVPFDIMGIKLLWWTWHDTDPNIYDRHYWVPWTSYYFHAAFASGFTFAFHGLRKLFSSETNKFRSAGFFTELVCCVLTGLLGFPLGTLQFLPLYHPLHDGHGIHTEVCVLLILSVYAMIVWADDRRCGTKLKTSRNLKRGWFQSIVMWVTVILHYLTYIWLVVVEKPEKIQSDGLHQIVGPCNETEPVMTMYGELSKKKYLCLENYDEAIFDFHCEKLLLPPMTEWYRICGTPFPNHVEYICVVWAFCALGLHWFWQILCRSGSLPTVKAKQS